MYFYGGIYQPFTCQKNYKNYKICNLIMLTCKHSVGMQLINVTLQLTCFEMRPTIRYNYMKLAS